MTVDKLHILHLWDWFESSEPANNTGSGQSERLSKPNPLRQALTGVASARIPLDFLVRHIILSLDLPRKTTASHDEMPINLWWNWLTTLLLRRLPHEHHSTYKWRHFAQALFNLSLHHAQPYGSSRSEISQPPLRLKRSVSQCSSGYPVGSPVPTQWTMRTWPSSTSPKRRTLMAAQN